MEQEKIYVNNFTKLSQNYFESRSQKDFAKIYAEIRIIAMSAAKGLTVDSHDYESIVDDIYMKLYLNFDKYYQENKSLLSFVFVSCKRKYYTLKKTYNKSICESDMIIINDKDGGETSKFNQALTNYYGDFVDQENVEVDAADNMLHLSTDRQIDRVKEIVKEMCYNDKGEFNEDEHTKMIDILTLRNGEFSLGENLEELIPYIKNEEVGSVSDFISPTIISNKYGIKNRATVSAKRTRAIEKIRNIILSDISNSEIFDKVNYTGTKIVKKDINGKIYTHTYELIDGVANGEYKKEILINSKKTTLTIGKFENGKKIGIWHHFFVENGSYMGYVDYNSGKSFEYTDMDETSMETRIMKLSV